MSDLAINGGAPAVSRPLGPYRSVGEDELAAVAAVLRSGALSGFIGAWGPGFYGGPVVQEFEAAWRAAFGVRHALTVNSATSGLIAAVGAARVGPGDEVIVPAYTMSATAMAPLVYGAIPVFVDIEPETFCLDPALVESNITARTRAIIAVNLFGHPAQLGRLRALADARGILLIEDNAQAPFASEGGRYAGTIGHVGVFSLNYHKHIHSGEGGVCVTADDDLALRIAMIRNHGENAVEGTATADLTNLIGFNFRMTEVTAAIGLAQLRHADRHVGARERVAAALTRGLGGLPGITPAQVRRDCRHVYYDYPLRFDETLVGVPRDIFADALKAEGVPNSVGYVAPLYLLPLFQQRVAIGARGFPFDLSARAYPRGLCPVTERMHERELISFALCAYAIDDEQTEQLIAAVRKVYAARDELATVAR